MQKLSSIIHRGDVQEHKKETGKTSALSFTRHRKELEKDHWYFSAKAQHVAQTNHTIDLEDVSAQALGWHISRKKEAIHIHNTTQHMNRPQGERHQLSHILNTIPGNPIP